LVLDRARDLASGQQPLELGVGLEHSCEDAGHLLRGREEFAGLGDTAGGVVHGSEPVVGIADQQGHKGVSFCMPSLLSVLLLQGIAFMQMFLSLFDVPEHCPQENHGVFV
jgi:hypothetical protein